MKQWKKPDMVNLDVKFTENLILASSGICNGPTCEDFDKLWNEIGSYFDSYCEFVKWLKEQLGNKN